jgi:hypothetical protein
MTYTDSTGLLWTRDQPVAETCTCQYSQEKNAHVPGEIQTNNPSKRAAADPHLRQRSQRVCYQDFPLSNPFLFPVCNHPIV